MALYKVLRLNKMSSGSRRGLIDMDIQLNYIAANDLILLRGLSDYFEFNQEQLSALGIMTESGDFNFIRDKYIENYYNHSVNPLAYEQSADAIVLNETQVSIDPMTLSDSLSVNQPYALQLTPMSWLSSEQVQNEILSAFNLKQQRMHVIFEFEVDQIANDKACLNESSVLKTFPLNDLLDLCIKSRFKKTLKNSNVPFNLNQPANDIASYNSNVDQWLVLDEYPIDFCQFNGDSYMLTHPIDTQPYRVQSTLKKQIMQNDTQLQHSFEYVRDPIKTFLYRSVDEYGVSSYSQYLTNSENGDLLNHEQLAEFFTPDVSIKKIKYNYIVSIDQCSNANRMYDNPTVYENGDIYGSFQLAKNMYNALYSIDMPQNTLMKNCRRYCGLHNSANSIVLKYYDDIDYFIQLSADASDSIADSQKKTSKVPYQKIEFYQPQQMTTVAQHKSNLFSVRVSNTNLDDAFIANHDEQYKYVANNVKKDIMNGIRALAESIAPANTQLFTTYFQ